MPEIISAKCFGCGHVVKVPAALGGKKARCPKCTNTITIPSPGDSSEDFVSDELLPEVARDEDPIEGEIIEEDGSAPPEPVTESQRRRGSSSAWSKSSATGMRSREAKGGTRLRGGVPSRQSSSAGLIVGIVVAVAVVVVLIVALAGGGSKPPVKPKHQPEDADNPPPDRDPAAESELETRCTEYFRAIHRGDLTKTLEFYSFDPADHLSVKKGVSDLLSQGDRYGGLAVNSTRVTGDTGTTTFVTDKEIKLNWRRVDGTWKIADKP